VRDRAAESRADALAAQKQADRQRAYDERQRAEAAARAERAREEAEAEALLEREQEQQRRMDEEAAHAARGNCPVCQKELGLEAVVADDIEYHPACFKCNDCSADISSQYFRVGKHLVCNACAEKRLDDDAARHAPACDVCGKRVSGQYLTLGAQNMCRTCLRCALCSKQLFEGGTQAAFKVLGDGRRACAACYDKGQKLCDGCRQPLTGQYSTVLGHAYHPACIACKKCGKKLAPDDIYEDNGWPSCEPCAPAS